MEEEREVEASQIAERLGVALVQVVYMGAEMDAFAAHYGLVRQLGHVFKIVDDLEYPCLVLIDSHDWWVRRSPIAGTRRIAPPATPAGDPRTILTAAAEPDGNMTDRGSMSSGRN